MPGHEAESIEQAARCIDPVFRDSPQFLCAPLSERAGREVVLKVETFNPIRSFKGRGADWFAQQLPDDPPALVCASAGNFGQGLAYVAAQRGIALEVFAAETASPLKVDRMRRLGATVRLVGRDLDEAKAAAREVADHDGRRFVEDGAEPAITEGAGTIADGVAVRVPVPEAVAELPTTTDEIHLVTEEEIVAAMQLLDEAAGLGAEPSGALPLAALDRVPGQRIALVVTGANLSEEQRLALAQLRTRR